jgi:hypothetical protein
LTPLINNGYRRRTLMNVQDSDGTAILFKKSMGVCGLARCDAQGVKSGASHFGAQPTIVEAFSPHPAGPPFIGGP